MPADPNLVLVVASYDQESDASLDFTVLKAAAAADELKILSAEVATRKDDGKVRIKEHEAGAAAGAIGWGAAFGLAFGMFSPAALATTVAGAAIGAVCHEIAKHHDEHEQAKELEQYLAPGTTAILVLADDTYADRLDRVLERAERRVSKAVDSGDVEKLDKALDKSDAEVTRALQN